MNFDYLYPTYKVHPELQKLFDRVHPPGVSIDNDTCKECSIVKVDSVNRHGILLEVVQILIDLDLIISKSYICSDGGWFMDVFHVTDKRGNKVTKRDLIHYIEERVYSTRGREMPKEVEEGIGRELRPYHACPDSTAIEMVGTDSPGLMSEIAAVLFDLGCLITAVVAWTHKSLLGCILFVEDGVEKEAIRDGKRVALMEEMLEAVLDARSGEKQKRNRVRLIGPGFFQTHTERRMHQMMYAERDYENCRGCEGPCADTWYTKPEQYCLKTHVTIESCEQKGYSIVHTRSRDRPKLLFDTVCVLTDLEFDVSHAAITAKDSLAVQEYFIRRKNGCMLVTEAEKRHLIRCLVAGIERRASHGVRLDLLTYNRMGVLSDITRVLRENGLSILRTELGTKDHEAIGSIYVTDTLGQDVSPSTIEVISKEMGGDLTIVQEAQNQNAEEDKRKSSLGTLLRSPFAWLSSNFSLIKS